MGQFIYKSWIFSLPCAMSRGYLIYLHHAVQINRLSQQPVPNAQRRNSRLETRPGCCWAWEEIWSMGGFMFSFGHDWDSRCFWDMLSLLGLKYETLWKSNLTMRNPNVHVSFIVTRKKLEHVFINLLVGYFLLIFLEISLIHDPHDSRLPCHVCWPCLSGFSSSRSWSWIELFFSLGGKKWEACGYWIWILSKI